MIYPIKITFQCIFLYTYWYWSICQFIVIESVEKVFNILSWLNEQKILLLFQELFGITIQDFWHLLKVLMGSTTLGSQLRESLFLSSVIVLNLNPHFIEFSSIKFTDFLANIVIIITIVFLGMEVTKVFVKVFFWWFNDNLSLFYHAIFLLSWSKIVHLICIFVLGSLSSSLVVNTLSNVLVFDDSNTFITVSSNELNKFLVGLIFFFLVILLDHLIECRLLIEKLLDVFLSSFSKVFIKSALHLSFITNIICCGHGTCANLLYNCAPGTTRS